MTRVRRRSLVACALAAGLAPAAARADRGALTLELGPSLAISPRWPAPASGAGGFAAAAPGAILGLRYAPTNHLELSAEGLFQAPASGTASVVDAGGVVVATAAASLADWGVLVGLRVVAGLAWRFHVGADLGWQHLACSRLTLSGPGGGSLPAPGAGRDAAALAAGAGLRWQGSDRLSVAVAPRLEVLLGAPATLVVLVPVTLGFSWYLF